MELSAGTVFGSQLELSKLERLKPLLYLTEERMGFRQSGLDKWIYISSLRQYVVDRNLSFSLW